MEPLKHEEPLCCTKQVRWKIQIFHFWIQNVYGFLLCNQGRFRKCDGSEFEDTCEWPGLDWALFVFLNFLSPQPFLKVPVFLPLHIWYHILRIKRMFGMFIDPVVGWHWGKLWIFESLCLDGQWPLVIDIISVASGSVAIDLSHITFIVINLETVSTINLRGGPLMAKEASTIWPHICHIVIGL